ncbi:TPA: nodulation protein NfeD [Candidatus Poribacteria bacterium]|nr:nodulation protein NfeD [Candidatus Poribacteria bacterium]
MKKAIITIIFFVFLCGIAYSEEFYVDLVEFNDLVINPVTSKFLIKAIDQADSDGSQCLIVMLDTPGGLQKSMETIYKAMLNSAVPIVVFVAPDGAQATSAGVFVALSSHILAMAPGTKIGSAHPVALGAEKMDEDVKNKIVEHTVGEVKKIAELKGRNVEWAEKSVRDSISSTWKEAYDKKVIDLIADNINDLLAKIDGKEVITETGKRILHTKNAKIRNIKMSLRERLLDKISDPNVAYMLLIIGFYGIFFELSNPGAVFPGILGGISIILAFFALQTLPVNYAGILLILLALILFILEVKVTSYGALSIGGITAMILGSLMLIDSSEPYAYIFKISFQLILPAVIVTAVFFIFGMVLVARTQKKKITTGREGLIGSIGVCSTEINPEGKVFLHGELWNSISDEHIMPKEKVKVIDIDGFTLKVEKVNKNNI